MKKWIRSTFTKLKENELPIFLGIFILLVVFRIWLITGIPQFLIFGPHDDLYFAKAAHYIIHGQWMGPYDQMTLIKVPFYSFFLILSFLTGLPLFLNETIFYLGACIVLFCAFSPLIKSRWWRLLLFTILAYAPASLATLWNLRVYREFVYFSLTLYVVAFSMGLFLRLNRKATKLLFWSLGLGISMGAFMITREEGVWIYPILFLLLSGCLLLIWLRKMDQKFIRTFLVLLPILLWQIPGFVVSYLNYSHYEFWGVTEQLDPDFNRVLSTLDRIKTGGAWYPAIQIPKEARMEAYAVSPILNQMKDTIEASVITWNYYDDLGMDSKPAWYLSQYGNGGSEIGNGHFLWLLRDTVTSQGYYANGKYPRDLFKQLADQLEAACDDGRLDCSPPMRIPLVGSIDRRHYPIILRMLCDGVINLLNQNFQNTRIMSLDIKTWPAWPEGYVEYEYFDEFVYNSINGPGIPSGQDAQYLVNGNTDLRLKILPYKETLMAKIVNIYKRFTLPAFITCFIAWLFLLVFSISKKWRAAQESFLIVSVFMMGIFISRLLTLVIVDATTSVSGMFFYGASNYLFIYVFSFLMLYWIFKQAKEMIIKKQE